MSESIYLDGELIRRILWTCPECKTVHSYEIDERGSEGGFPDQCACKPVNVYISWKQKRFIP